MSSSSPFRLTAQQWCILAIAAIGFLFDSYELLMTPLVAPPAIAELLHLPSNSPEVAKWMGRILSLSALCGGVFGLMGGWLIDRFGRKRIMVASIFLYAFSPFAAAFSQSLGAFIFFRCTTFIGVCVEFVAAITWLAELFPDRRQKEIALGATQAFASLGGILVTVANTWIVARAPTFPALPIPEIFNAHATWRYTLMTGLLPAIPIAILLPFVPESQVWSTLRANRAFRRPSFLELFSPRLRRVTLVTAGLSACAYAAAFGALQLTPRQIVPGLPELKEERAALAPMRVKTAALIAELGEASKPYQQMVIEVPKLAPLAEERIKIRQVQGAAKKVIGSPKASEAAKAASQAELAKMTTRFGELDQELTALAATRPEVKQVVMAREKVMKQLGENRAALEPPDAKIKARGNQAQFYQEIGGLTGRIILALLVVSAIRRRALLRLFLVPGVIIAPLVYFSAYHTGGTTFNWGIFAVGMLVVAQFSYFGEYLPKVFPPHLRGTGGAFATNVGGRMIGTSAAFIVTGFIAPKFVGSTYDSVALAAGIMATSVFLIGLILSFFLPEPPAADELDGEYPQANPPNDSPALT